MVNTQSALSIVVLFLVFGFFYTFSYKLQGSQIVYQGMNGSITKTFFHPYMQGVSFFIGQSLCLLVLYFTPNSSPLPTTYSTKIFIIPAISDLITVMMQCSALALISGSTFMMLKGATIVTTLVFSYWFIDFKIRSRHIFGCGLAVVGLAIVGMADIFLSDTKVANDSSDLQTIGYILMVTSLISNGFLYAYEQKLLKQYEISPLHMVGWQGVYGTLFSLILVTVLSFTPCPYAGNKCVYNSQGVPYTEIPTLYIYQMFSSILLFTLIIAGLVSNAFYNFYGVTITQTMDSLTRSLLNVCRTALIWMVGIIVSLNVDEGSPYRIQSLKLSVNFVKLIGFASIISGTLTYNQIILSSLMKRLDDMLFPEPKSEVQMKLVQPVSTQKIQIEKQDPYKLGLTEMERVKRQITWTCGVK